MKKKVVVVGVGAVAVLLVLIGIISHFSNSTKSIIGVIDTSDTQYQYEKVNPENLYAVYKNGKSKCITEFDKYVLSSNGYVSGLSVYINGDTSYSVELDNFVQVESAKWLYLDNVEMPKNINLGELYNPSAITFSFVYSDGHEGTGSATSADLSSQGQNVLADVTINSDTYSFNQKIVFGVTTYSYGSSDNIVSNNTGLLSSNESNNNDSDVSSGDTDNTVKNNDESYNEYYMYNDIDTRCSTLENNGYSSSFVDLYRDFLNQENEIYYAFSLYKKDKDSEDYIVSNWDKSGLISYFPSESDLSMYANWAEYYEDSYGIKYKVSDGTVLAEYNGAQIIRVPHLIGTKFCKSYVYSDDVYFIKNHGCTNYCNTVSNEEEIEYLKNKIDSSESGKEAYKEYLVENFSYTEEELNNYLNKVYENENAYIQKWRTRLKELGVDY